MREVTLQSRFSLHGGVPEYRDFTFTFTSKHSTYSRTLKHLNRAIPVKNPCKGLAERYLGVIPGFRPDVEEISALLGYYAAYSGRGQLKCDGTRAETRFRLSAKRTSPFKPAGASVQSTTGSRGVRISGSNAGYTMFRGSVKSTGNPLHSSVSPSLPLPCVTVCHYFSTGLHPLYRRLGGPQGQSGRLLYCARRISTNCHNIEQCLRHFLLFLCVVVTLYGVKTPYRLCVQCVFLI